MRCRRGGRIWVFTSPNGFLYQLITSLLVCDAGDSISYICVPDQGLNWRMMHFSQSDPC